VAWLRGSLPAYITGGGAFYLNVRDRGAAKATDSAGELGRRLMISQRPWEGLVRRVKRKTTSVPAAETRWRDKADIPELFLAGCTGFHAHCGGYVGPSGDKGLRRLGVEPRTT